MWHSDSVTTPPAATSLWPVVFAAAWAKGRSRRRVRRNRLCAVLAARDGSVHHRHPGTGEQTTSYARGYR